MTEDIRNSLRAEHREKRQNLSAAEQEVAAMRLFNLIGNEDFFRVAQRIAFYQVMDGEINPRLLRDLALSEGKAVFLPVVPPDTPDSMSFAPYDERTELIENQWGIEEPPMPEVLVSPSDFDVVFVPLVGFTNQCFRMGMGKGFYDRTFSFKIFNRRSRPLLVGLAHEFQLTDSFPVESWDVRLDAIATDKKIYRPNTA